MSTQVHRCVGPDEHDGRRSLYHGCCAVCLETWPCSTDRRAHVADETWSAFNRRRPVWLTRHERERIYAALRGEDGGGDGQMNDQLAERVVRSPLRPEPWLTVDDYGQPMRMAPAGVWEAIPDADGMVTGGDEGLFYEGEDRPTSARPVYRAAPLEETS